MSIFGWSYPPGAANDPYAPYNQTEEPIDLTDGYTIRGYGRSQHGLNGKDADLNYGGQNKVKSAWWFESGKIQVDGTRYASIVPNDEVGDDLLDIGAELVAGCGYAGEWDGDYWVVSEDYSLTLQLDWNNDLTDERNIEAACQFTVDAISKDSHAFETAMAELAKDVEKATATDNE